MPRALGGCREEGDGRRALKTVGSWVDAQRSRAESWTRVRVRRRHRARPPLAEATASAPETTKVHARGIQGFDLASMRDGVPARGDRRRKLDVPAHAVVLRLRHIGLDGVSFSSRRLSRAGFEP